MGSNFNVGSFNAIDTNEDTTKKSKSSGGNDDLRKKLIFLAAIIIGGVVIIAIIMFAVSVLFPKAYTYDEIEKIMTSAAEAYFEDHPNRLPQSDSERVDIDTEILASGEYMKPMIEYTGENLSCSGYVSVQTNGDNYLYIPRLDCGEEYVTQPLYEAVTKNVVDSGYGLYETNDGYVFRGEDVNNYVKLDLALWRIVDVNDDNQIRLVLATDMSEAVPWDDRYNNEIGYNIGINTYSTSRLKEAMEDLYKSNDEFNAVLSDHDRSMVVPYDLCVGKRSTGETTTDNSVECSEVLENQKMGLLTASDYMTASLDPNCKTVIDHSCQNYNYLVNNDKWWLATAVAGVSDEAYGVGSNGVCENINTSTYMYPRPVIVIDGNVLYKSGKGTLNKPYKIK